MHCQLTACVLLLCADCPCMCSNPTWSLHSWGRDTALPHRPDRFLQGWVAAGRCCNKLHSVRGWHAS